MAVVAVAEAFAPPWTSIVILAAEADVPTAAVAVCSSEAIVPETLALPPDCVSLLLIFAACTLPPDCVKFPVMSPVAVTVPADVEPSAKMIVPA